MPFRGWFDRYAQRTFEDQGYALSFDTVCPRGLVRIGTHGERQTPWESVPSKAGRFSVEMPAKPDIDRTRTRKGVGGAIKIMTIGCKTESGVYLAYRADLPQAILKGHDEVFPQDVKVEEVLFASVCGEEAATIVRAHRKSEDCPEQDERILIKGGIFFTVAVLSEVAKLRNGTTYLKTLPSDGIASKAGREKVRQVCFGGLPSWS